MASLFSFGGLATRRPTVRALVDDTRMIPTGTGSTRIVALIGASEGGEPQKPEFFNSSIQATARHRGGDIYKALPLVFAPSPESRGAAIVCTVRVNPATKATLTLLDDSAGNAMVVSSANWGARENGITIKVETGTANGKKVTVSNGTVTVGKDNLYRAAFSLQYTGAGSACAMTIDGDSLATTATGAPSDDLTIDFNAYTTVKALVDFIDAQANYAATLLTLNGAEATLNGLDFVTGQDIRTSTFTVTATLAEIVKWFNSGAQSLVTATRASGAGLPPANIGTTYLAGGGEGTVDAAAWQAALDALAEQDVTYLAPLTDDASLHAKVLAHVAEQSANGQRQRRAFVGAALGESSADLSNYRTRAQGLNSDRVVLVPTGISVTDATSQVVTMAPYFLAAQLAGMQSGLPEIGDALTNKVVSINALEWTPTPAQIELGIAYGLLMVAPDRVRGGFRVERGITTWLKDDSYHRVEISTGEALDEVIRRIVTALEFFKGKKASPIMVHRVVSKAEEVLRSLTRDSIIVGDPAFKNIVGELQGDTVFLSFECSPVLPLNFIGVTIHAVPFTGTFTVAVA